MSSKILYLSCHEILESEEVQLFNELGYEIFSPGAYVCNENRGDQCLRPAIPGLVYDPDIVEQWHKLCAANPGEDGKDHLTKEFVDNFDIVIVMHLPRWIVNNWQAMKHKRVIWRTIGQSISPVEQQVAFARAEGMEIVRYSPKENNIPGFIGSDALIRFYKDPELYKDWNGKDKSIVSFGQSMKARGPACNFPIFDQVTTGLPRKLYGPGNEDVPWAGGKVSFDRLRSEMRDNRVYFYTGTHPASYTLNFMEAFMTGIPIVGVGHQYGNASYFHNHDLYEVPDLITNYSTGFISNNPAELRSFCKLLLENDAVAQAISTAARQEAIKHFGKEMIMAAWKDYLEKGGK